MAIREIARVEHWLDPDPQSNVKLSVKIEWVGETLQVGSLSNGLWLDEVQQFDLFRLLRDRHD